MRHYELVTILSPMLSQDQANEAWGQINNFITNRNGDIFQEQPWGTRRLAYPIQQGSYHFLEGNYRLIRFSTETPFNQALENYLRMDERVLRSLVISIPNREILPDPAAARPAPAAAAATAPAPEGATAPAEAPPAEAAAPAPDGDAAPAPAAEASAEPSEFSDPALEAAAATTSEPEAPTAAAAESPAAEAEAPAPDAEAPATEQPES